MAQQPARQQDVPGVQSERRPKPDCGEERGRAGQPAEPAPVYALPASDAGSYVSGARAAGTGGNPIL